MDYNLKANNFLSLQPVQGSSNHSDRNPDSSFQHSEPQNSRELTYDEEAIVLEILLKDTYGVDLTRFFNSDQSVKLKLGKAAELLGFSTAYLFEQWWLNLRPFLITHLSDRWSTTHVWSYMIANKIESASKIDEIVRRQFNSFNKRGLRLRRTIPQDLATLDENTKCLDKSTPYYRRLKSQRILRILHLFDEIRGVYE